MVEISQLDSANYPSYLVTSSGASKEGLVIHGYGSNKEEILGLAVSLALRLDLKLLVFDLPGHGETKSLLTLANCREALNWAMSRLEEPTFFIGHSLGAYLGLMTGVRRGILVSMPGKAWFDGGRRDLLRILRAKRVRESTPYAGLQEIFSAEIRPAPKMLMLRAENELGSVLEKLAEWEKLGFESQKIEGSSHLDVISSPLLAAIISQWLKRS